jgi:hypothetical protein
MAHSSGVCPVQQGRALSNLSGNFGRTLTNRGAPFSIYQATLGAPFSILLHCIKSELYLAKLKCILRSGPKLKMLVKFHRSNGSFPNPLN